MPYDIEFVDRVVRIRFHGEVTAADIAGFTAIATGREDFDDQRYHVLDFSGARLPPLDEQLLLATSGMVGAAQTNLRLTGIVIPDTPETRALVSYCEPTLGNLPVQFFASEAAADDWISNQSGTMRIPFLG